MYHTGSYGVCDSTILGKLSQQVIQRGAAELAIPRSACHVSGSLKEVVLPLFSRLSGMTLPAECGFGFCLDVVKLGFKDGEKWVESRLTDLMKDFPTKEHKQHMARQREKTGLVMEK